jgi:excisionase family DNA binding protein
MTLVVPEGSVIEIKQSITIINAPASPELGGLWNTEQAADYLSISAETLRRLCRRKAITFIQVTPSEYRFDLPDLVEYKEARRNRRKSGVR